MPISPFHRRAICSSLFLCLTVAAAAQQTNPSLITNAPRTQAEIDAHKELTGEARAQRMAAALTADGMPAVVLIGNLHRDLKTHSAKVDDEVLLTVDKPVTLPGGPVLQHGTVIRGHIVQTAAHSKTNANGGMLITFDTAKPSRGEETTPLFALIAAISPSVEEMGGIQSAIHQGTIGATSNSPNASIVMNGGVGDAVISQSAVVSGIPGVLLVASPGGSGILLAPKDDVTMYASQRMILVAGVAGAEATTARAYAVLHPAKAGVAAGPGKASK